MFAITLAIRGIGIRCGKKELPYLSDLLTKRIDKVELSPQVDLSRELIRSATMNALAFTGDQSVEALFAQYSASRPHTGRDKYLASQIEHNLSINKNVRKQGLIKTLEVRIAP